MTLTLILIYNLDFSIDIDFDIDIDINSQSHPVVQTSQQDSPQLTGSISLTNSENQYSLCLSNLISTYLGYESSELPQQ